jgi:hypothetical protein
MKKHIWRRVGIITIGVALVAVAAVAAGCGSTSSSSSPSPVATSGRPTVTATPVGVITSAPGWPGVSTSDFVAAIDNPWFPLKVGTTWVSKGVKDGKPTIDTYTVTGQTKVIAGVTCSVIRDTLTVHGKAIEATADWYAQDKQGNVWYVGEDTKEYNAAGQVTSTAGTWQTGVNGARPGIFMPADPGMSQGGYQEYLPGQALDRYKVISTTASITVPAGTFKNCLETQETTALEPGVLDHKYYVKGLGQVAEETVKGPKETSFLVRYTKQ